MYIMILCHANSEVAFKRMTLMSKCLKSSHFCKIFDIFECSVDIFYCDYEIPVTRGKQFPSMPKHYSMN